MNRRVLLSAVIALSVVALPALAQLNQGVTGISVAELFPDAVYDEALPSPKDATGTEIGSRPLSPEEAAAYFRLLADQSPSARLMEFGRSHEGRPLMVLAVSDPATIADLDAFKAMHRALMDPRGKKLPAAADLGGTKAVAWLAYGIHGDELSSVDAAVAVAYRLVAGIDDHAGKLREKLVILIDPCENPDGRSRYLSQIFSFAHRTANPDPDDLSHTSVWPWGRGNHYLFDMNRDWFAMIHPESARSREIASWLPQLMVDSHEMGAQSTYLFSPPRHPFNPLLPASAKKWEQPFAADQARALDERGYPYFTGEWNEEFFPGYGSSWASYHGGVGILYEMSRTSGTLVRKREGTVRTFAQAVEHQTTSSLANLTTLADNAPEILADMVASRDAAAETGKGPRAWIFAPDSRHPGRLEKFAALLNAQGIEVHRLTKESVKASGLVGIRDGEERSVELDPGALMVRLDQPAGRMARVLLDPHVPMDDVFFQDEREYIEKRKGSRLYDTTAWSLALARGMDANWTTRIPGGDWKPWEPLMSLLGQPSVPREFGSLILDGDPDTTPRVLADLLQAGVTVRVARKPFSLDGREFGRGALVIRHEGNIEGLAEVMDDIAVGNAVQFLAVGTADTDDGPDLGGAEYPVLVAPRVGVLTGMPVSPTEYGYVWHLLDQELDLRFSGLDVGRIGRVDLSRYNVLVFPEVYGGEGMYRQVLGERGLKNIKSWIEAGGTAIGMGGGARLLADPSLELTRARFRDQDREIYPSPVWSIPAVDAVDFGPVTATGLRVPTGDWKKSGDKEWKRSSAYDVAPILGPGAAPFADGHPQGTDLETQPMAMQDWIKPILPPGKKGPEKEDLAAADARLRRFMPQGALLRAELDEEFWLNYGLPKDITVWFGADDPLLGSGAVKVAARFPEIDRLHLGGLLWPEAAARLAQTAYATRESRGRGQVILFADHPSYRRWMTETERMLLNAILLGPGLGARWSAPW